MAENATGYVANVSASAIEKQREELANRNRPQEPLAGKINFDPNNYLDTRLKDGEAERTVKIRILPISDTNPGIFHILHTHQLKVDTQISKSGFKSYICLGDQNLTPEEKAGGCPLCRKMNELLEKNHAIDPKDESRKDERISLFKQAMQYQPKDTYIVRVIDRDKEAEGVKFWRFNAHTDGKGIYDQLMSLYDIRNKEYVDAGQGPYNIFDLEKGKDIIIKLNKVANEKGELKTAATITDAGIPTPLSRDPKQAEAWIRDTKTWRNLYAIKPAEYLQIIADGKIPAFDKVNNCWTEFRDFTKERQEAEAKAKAEYEAGQQAAANIVNHVESTEVPGVVTTAQAAAGPSGAETGDDLPF